MNKQLQTAERRAANPSLYTARHLVVRRFDTRRQNWTEGPVAGPC